MRRWCWPAPAKQNPMALAERIAAALAGRELASGGLPRLRLHGRGGAARVSSISGSTRRSGTRSCARSCGPARLIGDSTIGSAASGSMSSSSRPTRPGRCMSGTAAARWSATRWPALLAKAGFAVQREYYINDAGAQVDVLARSAYLRYREALGESGRTHPRGLLSRRISGRDRPRACRARRRQMARPARGRMAARRSATSRLTR